MRKILVIITSEGGGGHRQAAENIKKRSAYQDHEIVTITTLSSTKYTPMCLWGIDIGQAAVKNWNNGQKNDGSWAQSFASSSHVIGFNNWFFGPKAQKFMKDQLEALPSEISPDDIEVIDCQPLFTPAIIDALHAKGIKKYTKVLTDAPSKDAIHFNSGLAAIEPKKYPSISINIEMLHSPTNGQDQDMAEALYPNLKDHATFVFTQGPIQISEPNIDPIALSDGYTRYTVMLGSQASKESEDIIQKIINEHTNPQTKPWITVFCGTNQKLQKKLEKKAAELPRNIKLEVYPNVANEVVRQTFGQSNYVYIRPGGLATMEVNSMLANPHLKKVYVLNSSRTAAPWEKGNIAYLKKRGRGKVAILQLQTPNRTYKTYYAFAMIILGLTGALYLHIVGILSLSTTVTISILFSSLLPVMFMMQHDDKQNITHHQKQAVTPPKASKQPSSRPSYTRQATATQPHDLLDSQLKS